MRWLGLDSTWLALASLMVGCALLFLYLQRRPRRRVMVPALSLWQAVLPARALPSPRRMRLRVALSLLLALAIAALLLVALGEPAPARATHGNHLLLVLDGSASMAARDVAPSRIERAKSEARKLVRALGPGDRAAVALLADGITPLTGLTTDRALLLRAIDRVSAHAAAADLRDAAELALDLLAPFARAELVLFSDGALTGDQEARRALATRPRILPSQRRVGASQRNVAVSELSARPYLLDHTHQEALVALTNFGAQAEPLTLRLSTGNALLSQEALTLPAGATITRVLSDLPTGGPSLRASISLEHGPDPLAQDDHAETPRSARLTRVLSVSRGNRYLEAALLLDEALEVSELSPESYRGAHGFDVVIFDGVLPGSPPETAALYLGPIASQGAFPLSHDGLLERPFFDRVAKAHPLVRELALSDVNVSRAARLTLGAGDVALVETQAHEPLLVEGQRNGTPFVVLGFDLRDSDLPLRAAFPLLFLRTLDRLSGARHATSRARGVSLQKQEGRITPRADVLGAPRALPPPGSATERWPHWWPALVLLALLLLLAEWLSFHRRWTV